MSEKLAVVVPAYNEQKTIHSTVESIMHSQTQCPDALIVVDNASTDTTAEIVEELQGEYPLLHLVHENQKGTGTACRTGFRYAIDEINAEIIARTDADTIPRPNWCAAIIHYFLKYPDKLSAAGITLPLKDEFYRFQDKVRVPGALLRRIVDVAMTRSAEPLTATYGHNMAIRSDAYETTSGFLPTSIAECDEDIVLFHELYNMYGRESTGFNRHMVVATSARRVRKLGYMGTKKYYDNNLNVSVDERVRRRLELMDGEIDIR